MRGPIKGCCCRATQGWIAVESYSPSSSRSARAAPGFTRRARLPAGCGQLGGIQSRVLSFAAAARQRGALALSPSHCVDSGLRRRFSARPRSSRHDFVMLCETPAAGGGGQYQGVCCPQTLATTWFPSCPELPTTPISMCRCFLQWLHRCALVPLGRPPGQGVRVRLGSGLWPERWHIHSPSPGAPWQVLQFNFWDFPGWVALVLPTRPPLQENDRLHMAVGPWNMRKGLGWAWEGALLGGWK